MQEAPRYIINPMAVTKSIWIPEVHQVLVSYKNKNYLNSLWIGVGWGVLSLPQIATRLILKPLFNFRLIAALKGVIGLPVGFAQVVWSGITGRAMAIDVTAQQVSNSILLEEHQGYEALAQGCDLVVLDVALLIAQENGLLPDGFVIPGYPAPTL